MTPFDPGALQRHYVSLTDDALLEIDRDSLTEAAQACWDGEVISRRLAIELPPPQERAAELAAAAEIDSVQTDSAKNDGDDPPEEDESWRGVVGGLLLHAAIAAFGVSTLLEGIPRIIGSGPRLELLRLDAINAGFAIILGYFVFALWPSLGARYVWIIGIGWLGVGALRGAAFPEIFFRERLEQISMLSITPMYAQWLLYTRTAIRLCFYSLGAWCFVWFPIRQLRNLKVRIPRASYAREPETRPTLVMLLLVLAAFAGQCAIAVFGGALAGNQIGQLLAIGIRVESMKAGILADSAGYALGAVIIGYAMQRVWPTKLALWVWVPGLLWFGRRIVAPGSLPADLAPASEISFANEMKILTDWVLYTSVAIRAVFYSLGAWLHRRTARHPATLAEAASGAI